MSRKTLLNICVPLVLSLITAVLTIEVGLRLFYRLIPLPVCADDYIIANYYCQNDLVYDKPVRLAYHYKPNIHYEGWWDPANPYLAGEGRETAPTSRNDKFWYVFQTDEMGFPNNRTEWLNQYDLVITGDSFITRTAPKTWIELLEEESQWTTLVLGASSWSTLNEVEAVKMYGLDKHPKWVVLLYFEGNDIINIAQYIEKRDSGLDWREYDLQNVPYSRRLLTPHLLTYLEHQLDPQTEPPPAYYRYPVTASTEAGPVQTVLKDIHLWPLSADYDTLAHSDEFAAVKGGLLELNQLVQAQDGRFLLVYVPSKEHIYWSRIWDPVDVNHILERTVTVNLSNGNSGKLQWQNNYLSYDFFNEHIGDQERLIEDFARDNQIEFLDLAPLFWQATIAHGEQYHFADPHWNQAGNQLTADAIYQYILSHP